ncbi:coiled-coil domain-containing protein 43-like [Mercenaria mercenaria]|uniref:coiled-coil domain-containing protein 43-like n=1 Tax=Mercenaria mercenaria TaxID=6596 RepID=UPI00234F1042|nr:coiled-coil domain-containing protein 43-like [Mercenaria mercenaria]
MAASTAAYENWLTEKLLSLNPDTDTDVFVSYITGILDEDAPEDEKKESVIELIGQVVEENHQCVCDELFKKWEEIHGSASQSSGRGDAGELTDHLAVILEKQKIETVKTREKTAEEVARKAAILAQYGHVSSGEDDDEDDDDAGRDNSGQDSDLMNFKNVNAESVKKNELEMREKSKLEAEKKKEKDKQDREMQKQKQKERKEGEKKRTQKGERRR